MITIKTHLKPDISPHMIQAIAQASVLVSTKVSRDCERLDEATADAIKASKRRLREIVYGEMETRIRGLAIAVNEMRREASNSREDERLAGIVNELFKLSRYSHNQLDHETHHAGKR